MKCHIFKCFVTALIFALISIAGCALCLLHSKSLLPCLIQSHKKHQASQKEKYHLLAEQVAKIRAKLRDTTLLIERLAAGQTFAKTNTSCHLDLTANVPEIDESEYDYMEQIEQRGIRTIPVNISVETMKYLQTSYFHHSSNNCSELKRSGGFYKPHAYKLYCKERNSIFQPETMGFHLFKIGLPNWLNPQFENNITVSWLHILHFAIVSATGNVYTKHGTIVLNGCKAKYKKVEIVPPEDCFHDRVFTIAQHYGQYFYHAFMEQLTRLSPYLDFLRRNTDIKIHVRASTPFVVGVMGKLGISVSRLISGSVGANILFVPAGQKCSFPSVFNVQYLSMELRLTLQDVDQKRNTIVVIQRSTKRWFKHQSLMLTSIQSHLKLTKLNVTVFADNASLSLPETMRLFNSAVMIVGPHGAAEANTVFSEPGTMIVEGLCYTKDKRKSNLCYLNLMNALGHMFYGIVPYPENCFDLPAKEVIEPVLFFLNKSKLIKA